MVTIFRPIVEVFINGFDVSSTVAPYLISVTLEDFFDTNFTTSKLDLTFHAKYQRTLSWANKDQIQIKLSWSTRPSFKLTSSVFYVDYVSDIKNQGGVQVYTVSALESDPSLALEYESNGLKYTNTTIRTAVQEFRDIFGLTLTDNLDLNVFMGLLDIPNVDGNAKISFNSFAEMLKYICQTFGYFGNLSGKKLEMIKIITDTSATPRFFMYPLQNIYSFENRQTYNNFAKTYQAKYSDFNNAGAITTASYQLPFQSGLSNKTRNLEFDNAYYNIQTAAARVYGEAFQDIVNSFEVSIRCFGLPEFAAGNLFLLDSSYGSALGYYRCTSVRHIVDGSGWNVEVKGLPLNILDQITATFKTGYTGRFQNPLNNINITDNLNGLVDTSIITAARLDAYAKYLNPNYNLNLGSIFIAEGNKAGNSIRAELAFCIALVMTKNFTVPLLNTRFNPGDLRTTLGGSTVATFANWTTGIRALIQRLFGYARASGSPADTIVDPAFNSIPRGTATDLFALNGIFTANTDWYGLVTDRVKYFYEFSFPNNTYSVF